MLRLISNNSCVEGLGCAEKPRQCSAASIIVDEESAADFKHYD